MCKQDGVKVSQHFKPGCRCIYFYPNTDNKRGEKTRKRIPNTRNKKKKNPKLPSCRLPAAQIPVLTWRFSSGPAQIQLRSSSAAGSSCAACRHWTLCSPSGTAAETLASEPSPCVYTHSSCVCTKVTGQQPHRAASFLSPRGFFPLQGKTAFRADGEGAAGRRGRHSQPGCVEFFLKNTLFKPSQHKL